MEALSTGWVREAGKSSSTRGKAMNASNRPIRILTVDDHEIVRGGIEFSLMVFDDLEVVGGARNGQEAISLCRELEPDVVLMDMRMPSMDGAQVTQVLRKLQPRVQVLALSSYEDPDIVRRAIEAGAAGYLIKGVSADELADAVRAVHRGKTRLSPEAMQALVQSDNGSPRLGKDLTNREREVLALLAEGYSNAQIAEALIVSLSTIKYHVHGILGKLGAANRAEAVALAMQHSLVVKQGRERD
jgi:NarL family two-component system response regulator LiaR